MVFNSITYYPILGIPLLAYGGLLTLISLLTTAYIGYMTFKGKVKIPFKWHVRIAVITLILALTHATFGLLANF